VFGSPLSQISFEFISRQTLAPAIYPSTAFPEIIVELLSEGLPPPLPQPTKIIKNERLKIRIFRSFEVL